MGIIDFLRFYRIFYLAYTVCKGQLMVIWYLRYTHNYKMENYKLSDSTQRYLQ
jgi:hypothetical protein